MDPKDSIRMRLNFTVNAKCLPEINISQYLQIHDLAKIQFSLIKNYYIGCTSSHSRIQELPNNSEIENSQNKNHRKISNLTVFTGSLSSMCGKWLSRGPAVIKLF